MNRSHAPASCAVCGADIPPNARACPECGADERTGWHEQSIYDGLDLPEEAFDGSENDATEKPGRGKARFWWVVAIIMLAVVVVLNRFWIAP